MEFDSKVSTNTPDQLVTNKFPVIERGGTILTGAGASYARGTVLGIITASGKYTIVDSTNSDGSQVARRILLEAVDATAADKLAPMAISGEFIEDSLVFGGTDTIATHRAALQEKSIFTKPLVEDSP